MKKIILTILLYLSFPIHAQNNVNKGVFNERGGTISFTTINGNPLTVNVGADASFQVFSSEVGTTGQFYPSTQDLADSGWFLRTNNTLYAPDFASHGGSATSSIGTYTPFSNFSVSPVSGNGTAANPYLVTTSAQASTEISFQQTISYVNGENFFRKTLQLDNSSADPINVTVFFAGDIYLANSDSGQPIIENQSPGGKTCDGITPVYNIILSGVSPNANRYTATQYSDVWSQINSGTLDNTIDTSNCLDNGAGVQWNISIPANASASIEALTSFGDIPIEIGGGNPSAEPTVVPVNNPIALLLLLSCCLALGFFTTRKIKSS